MSQISKLSSRRRVAFESLVALLKRSSLGVANWYIDEGLPEGDDPRAKGATSVSLEPALAPWTPIGTRSRERVYEETIRVTVGIRTPHDRWADDADLWGRIVDVLVGRGLDRGARRDHWRRLNAGGVFDVEATQEPADGGPGVLTITTFSEG
jgi:hypothetical protein